ncbi:ATP-dependent Clp protease proteolytic subunit 5, chloroplastic-like isoform X1 [Gossypium australe]|uniref:ATP-dependent Clp protease proteolytic subunit 5, chloroplastic-like isoform X1 n=1 Tax=Gossypium australe TaxID=47621 RepID=A0A5B6W201_9ROSI|nr:ATP-dependent Clp protease proteolytic subunit 5, chloroplastic-like isoform X1 [Gossypium australe]
MLHHKANLNGYLAYHTGQSLEKINQDTDRDFFMSAKEAKEYGLIDGVIMNPLKALQPIASTADAIKLMQHGSDCHAGSDEPKLMGLPYTALTWQPSTHT